MSTVTITASQLPELIRQLVARDTEVLRLAALEAAAYGEGAAVQASKDKGLVDRGGFIKSWNHQRIAEGAELRNDAPYAGVIEHGRRPGRPGPPLAPILAWVERKLVPNGQVKADEAAEVAFLIQRKLHIKGSTPHLILTNLRPHLLTMFRAECARRVQRLHGR